MKFRVIIKDPRKSFQMFAASETQLLKSIMEAIAGYPVGTVAELFETKEVSIGTVTVAENETGKFLVVDNPILLEDTEVGGSVGDKTSAGENQNA